jgi:hypothetical protein
MYLEDTIIFYLFIPVTNRNPVMSMIKLFLAGNAVLLEFPDFLDAFNPGKP